MPYTPTSPSADFDEAPLRRAQHRVGMRLGFSIHPLALLAMNVGLAAIVLSHGQLWSVWLPLGWDLGLATHDSSLAWSQGDSYQRTVDQEPARLREQASRR